MRARMRGDEPSAASHRQSIGAPHGVIATGPAPGRAASRKRVLIVQPLLSTAGGGSAVAAWIIEGLKREHDVTLLTWRRPDLERINYLFGTDLADRDFECREAPALLWRLLSLPPMPLALLKDSCLMHQARSLAPAYDVLISASGEHDLGGRGIQYVHYPRFIRLRSEDLQAPYHYPWLVRGYRRAALRLTGTMLARVSANRTLANSNWVAELYRGVHGGAVEILHPPAAGVFPAVPWEARADGIVCIGRFAGEKRLEYVIEVVERVRVHRPDVRLHVVGVVDDPRCADEVRRWARARSDWVTVHDGLSRGALCTLIAGQRYGIHGMAAEHFGMAVAEMVAGGCIPFVPNGGGQREIIGNDPRLQFASAAEGAEKIERVMTDAALQQTLLAALAPRRAAFTPEHFMRRVREVVAEFDAAPR
jgi:glycosyltransferase involved in cell wall biosynthesis